jgi:hypothetical protein
LLERLPHIALKLFEPAYKKEHSKSVRDESRHTERLTICIEVVMTSRASLPPLKNSPQKDDYLIQKHLLLALLFIG